MDNNTLAEVREALERISLIRRDSGAIASRDLVNESVRLAQVALAKLDALIEGQGWQPIETAPRNGTDIIVHRVSLSGKGFQPEVGEDRYCAIGRCWMRCKGDLTPTHWMPLPSPPQALTQGDKG